MDCLVANPIDRMSGLVGTLSNGVDDYMAAFFAGETKLWGKVIKDAGVSIQ